MKKYQVILIHVFFWLLASSLNFAFIIFREGLSGEYYLGMAIKTFFEALDFYLVYFLVIPYFFNRKRLPRFFMATVIYIAIFVLIYLTANYFPIVREHIKAGTFPDKMHFISSLYYTVLYAFLGGLFRLSIDGFNSVRQKALLEKQNAKHELAFLRSQINPHFLFNVLNTIHSFINSGNQNASKAVIKLSDIMRYMLSDASQDLIPLDKEIEYLKSYIELQNYRLEKSEFVDFKIAGQTSSVMLPPMLLIPFVENAFKHGKKDGEQTGIQLKLDVCNQELIFSISNHINPVKGPMEVGGEQLGLANATRRLELLFPGRHQLDIKTFDNRYTVHLSLILK